MRLPVTLAGSVLALVLGSCAPAFDPLPVAAPSWASLTPSRSDFFTPAAVLSGREKLDFWTGFALFRDPWIPSPASTTARDGLGPLFNAHACIACHAAGGRGDAQPNASALTVRVGVRDAVGAIRPHPVWGEQIQTLAVYPGPGDRQAGQIYYPGEAVVHTELREDRTLTFADGTTLQLQAPVHRLSTPEGASVADRPLLTARLAPALFGLGLLEAIPTQRLEALADPQDRDGDGISGRVHWQPASAPTAARQPGRFGWKAAHSTVRAQTATAFAEDMGITSTLRPQQNCTFAQARCRAQRHGDDPREGVEITDALLDYVVHFVAHVTPPPRPAPTPQLVRGARAFARAGCDGCHVPSHEVNTLQNGKLRLYARETIWPYTDLLLHDMGPGLAGELPQGEATASEWRTPPLWGLGASLARNANSGLLHDGRARTVAEAVAWHGGEGASARDYFLQLNAREREALAAFVRAL